MEKGNFTLKEKWSAPTNETMYECVDCKKIGKPHNIIVKPGPLAPGNEVSYKDDPTTIRICTGCGKYDGPWVPAPW
jgi:hypothetical protein